MLTLGFYVRPWIKVAIPTTRPIGRFEANYFQPERWKPEYPNPAFVNARPDDLFWGARHVVAITDEAILAVVRTADARIRRRPVPDADADYAARQDRTAVAEHGVAA